MIKTFLISLSILAIISAGYGQSKILDRYIEEGLQNNLSIKGTEIQSKIQNSAIQQAKKLWAPQVGLKGSYLRATGGRTIEFPVGDLFNPTYATLNQLTGTEQFPTDLENVNNQLTPDDFWDVQFNAAKPLINSSIKYNIKIQNELLNLENTNQELKQLEIVASIKTAYFNYLKSYEGLATIDESILILQELLKLNKTLVKYNKATIDAISDVEYRLANLESQKIGIKEQRSLAQSLFNLLLNRDLEADINIDRSIINSYDELNSEISEMTEEATDNRTELNQLSIAERINTLNQKRIQKEKSPELAVFGGVGIQGETTSLNTDGILLTTGLSLSLNILDGGLRKEKVQQLKLEREIIENNRAQLDQKIELEITQLYHQIKTIEAKIASQLIAMSSAEKSYKIQNVKYKNDRILLIELLQAQNRLTTSKIGLNLLKYDHLIKLAELDKALAKKK